MNDFFLKIEDFIASVKSEAVDATKKGADVLRSWADWLEQLGAGVALDGGDEFDKKLEGCQASMKGLSAMMTADPKKFDPASIAMIIAAIAQILTMIHDWRHPKPAPVPPVAKGTKLGMSLLLLALSPFYSFLGGSLLRFAVALLVFAFIAADASAACRSHARRTPVRNVVKKVFGPRQAHASTVTIIATCPAPSPVVDPKKNKQARIPGRDLTYFA